MRSDVSIAVLAAATTASASVVPRLDNGLGKTPVLGWNSWVSHLSQS